MNLQLCRFILGSAPVTFTIASYKAWKLLNIICSFLSCDEFPAYSLQTRK